MMRLLRYLIFLTFNISYRDGHVKINSTPRADATCILMLYEYLIAIVCIFFLSKHVDLGLISDTLNPLDNMVYGWGMLMFIIGYPINYYYFVKKGWLDSVYMEFKDAAMNTKRNRKIGYICLLLYLPIMLLIRKYWL